MKPLPTFAYPIHELLQKRWSPRAFAATPVPETALWQLLEAARWAPSSMNEQPWRFIYAHRADAERYAQLFDCLTERNQRWAATAPVLMLSLAQTKFANGHPNRWALHDLGMAVGNLLLQATALDLYVHPMGGFAVEKAQATFALSADLEPVAMMAVGYLGDAAQLPADLQERERAPRTRRPLEELLLK